LAMKEGELFTYKVIQPNEYRWTFSFGLT
jgi:hypothetical protein